MHNKDCVEIPLGVNPAVGQAYEFPVLHPEDSGPMDFLLDTGGSTPTDRIENPGFKS